jgi:multisubunit Na+/H+ antiporter MnhC subunit
MKISVSKTKEIVLQRPKPHLLLSLPAAVDSIEQVAEAKLLVFTVITISVSVHMLILFCVYDVREFTYCDSYCDRTPT